ncbi:hypothetical protein D3C80_1112520 [compost metagenome]
MLQRVVVAQHHAQFGLAVVVVDGAAQALGEPADHLGGQRLASAADGAQVALDGGFDLVTGGQQQAVGGGRTGQVGDAVLADDPAGALHGETAFVEGGGVAHGQRAGHGVVKAVSPARVGQVPEIVLGTQVHRIAHVADEGDDRLERHGQGLGQARGAGGEHQQEGVFGLARHWLEGSGLALQLGPEILAHGQNLRCTLHLVQLGPIGQVGDHQLRAGALHPVLDGLGAEGGEQRLIDSADTPGAKDGDQQFRGAWQQAGDAIAGAHALAVQVVGEARGRFLELGEGPVGPLAVAALPIQGDAS